MDWKIAIGEKLYLAKDVNDSAMACAAEIFGNNKAKFRVPVYFVTERLTQECCGGIQRFYCHRVHNDQNILVRTPEAEVLTEEEAIDLFFARFAQIQALNSDKKV